MCELVPILLAERRVAGEDLRVDRLRTNFRYAGRTRNGRCPLFFPPQRKFEKRIVAASIAEEQKRPSNRCRGKCETD